MPLFSRYYVTKITSCILFLDLTVAQHGAKTLYFSCGHETMAGLRIPNTPIVVDYWTIKELPANCIFFLTHAHAGECLCKCLME